MRLIERGKQALAEKVAAFRRGLDVDALHTLKPHRMLRMSATCASSDSRGWQHGARASGTT